VPTVFRQEGYRFVFFSNEGGSREPPHIHVRIANAEAKFWLDPEIHVACSNGFSARDLRELARIVVTRKELIARMWMRISASKLRFDEDNMWVELSDGRTLGVPLAWFPRLLHAASAERLNYEIRGSGAGLHWPYLDEDISVAGLLAGRADETRSRPHDRAST
jgi:hypothetical protein